MTLINTQVTDPSSTANPDGSQPAGVGDRNGALLIRPMGGNYYAASARGNLYHSSTLIAGVTVPAPATTLASKAGMVNPLGSGRNLELVAIGVSSVTIQVVLKQLMMEFQLNASTTGGVPTTITKLTAYSSPLSVGASVAACFAYSAATMTNAAANPLLIPFFGNIETAVGYIPTYQRFGGEIVMGPDTVMAITITTALAAVNFHYIWAEWPV